MSIDERLEELAAMWEDAVDNDKDIAANHLYQRLLALGASQTEQGEWVLGEENV